MSIADLIAKEREKRGISQRELSRRIGKHVSYISRIERNDREVGVDVLEDIAEALNTSITTFATATTRDRNWGGRRERKTPAPKFVPERLAQCRAELGWSQLKLSHALECAPNQPAGWESGKTQPRRDSVEKMAAVFGKPVEWFYTEMPLPISSTSAEDTVTMSIPRSLEQTVRALVEAFKNPVTNRYKLRPGLLRPVA